MGVVGDLALFESADEVAEGGQAGVVAGHGVGRLFDGFEGRGPILFANKLVGLGDQFDGRIRFGRWGWRRWAVSGARGLRVSGRDRGGIGSDVSIRVRIVDWGSGGRGLRG